MRKPRYPAQDEALFPIEEVAPAPQSAPAPLVPVAYASDISPIVGDSCQGSVSKVDGTYQACCACGWEQTAFSARHGERKAWVEWWDHTGLDWRAQPVYRSGHADGEKGDRRRAKFVTANYAEDYVGPYLTVTASCSKGSDLDAADGNATSHGCSGVITNGRVFGVDRTEICVDSCHDSDDELPRRCMSSDCTEVATVFMSRSGDHELNTVDGNRCATHFVREREMSTMFDEVGNRAFYEGQVGWHGVRRHDQYPTDPDFVPHDATPDEAAEMRGSMEAWRWTTYLWGTQILRRDPATRLAEQNWLESIKASGDSPDHRIDMMWKNFLHDARAAWPTLEVDVNAKVPDDVRAVMSRTEAVPPAAKKTAQMEFF